MAGSVGRKMITDGLITCFDAANPNSGLTASTSVWNGLGQRNATATPVSSPGFSGGISTLGDIYSTTRGGYFSYSGNNYHNISNQALNVPYTGKTIMAAVSMANNFKLNFEGAPNYGFRNIVGKANSSIGPVMLGRNWNLYVFNDTAGSPDTNFKYHFQNWGVSDYVNVRPNAAFIVAFTQKADGDYVFYHNGRPCGSGSPGSSYFTQYMYDPNCPERIGASGNNPATGQDAGGYWRGNIYNVSFYSRALSEEEILNNYRVLRNRMAISGSFQNPVSLPE